MTPREPGGDPDYLRRLFACLLQHGPLESDELIKRARWSSATRRRRFPELERDGWIRVGREKVHLGPQVGSVLVVEVERRRLRVAAFTADARLVDSAGVERDLFPHGEAVLGREEFAAIVEERVRELLAKLEDPIYPAAVVATWPARISLATGEPAPQKPPSEEWRNPRVKELLGQALGAAGFPELPADVLNAADAEAMGEAHVGVAVDSRPVVVVRIGEGVGGGTVLRDSGLLRGNNGFAGELGHVPVSIPPPEDQLLKVKLQPDQECACGGTGHLQCYASAEAIADRLEPGDDDMQTRAGRIAKRGLTEREVGDAFRESGEILGQALCGPVAVMDPAMVVLRIDPLMKHEELLAGVRTKIGEPFRPPPEVRWGTLDDPFFPLQGAATYAIAKHVEPRLDEAAEQHGAPPARRLTPVDGSA